MSFRHQAKMFLHSRGHWLPNAPANTLLVELCCSELQLPKTACNKANQRRITKRLINLRGPP